MKTAKEVYAIAYAIAERAHAGQFREIPDARPYFEHVKDVAALMPTWELKTVAILHDAIEDTVDKPEGVKVTRKTLEAADIPDDLIIAVEAMTKPKGADYEEYIRKSVKPNPLAVQVKLADNYVNLRDRLAALFAGDQSVATKIHQYGTSIKILTES